MSLAAPNLAPTPFGTKCYQEYPEHPPKNLTILEIKTQIVSDFEKTVLHKKLTNNRVTLQSKKMGNKNFARLDKTLTFAAGIGTATARSSAGRARDS